MRVSKSTWEYSAGIIDLRLLGETGSLNRDFFSLRTACDWVESECSSSLFGGGGRPRKGSGSGALIRGAEGFLMTGTGVGAGGMVETDD